MTPQRTFGGQSARPANRLVLEAKDHRLGPCYSASIGSLAREGQMSICLRRRDFITLLGGAAAWPLAAPAQQPAMPVVGFLSNGSLEGFSPYLATFRQGLGEAGFVEGRNVAIEYRWADNDNERLQGMA